MPDPTFLSPLLSRRHGLQGDPAAVGAVLILHAVNAVGKDILQERVHVHLK